MFRKSDCQTPETPTTRDVDRHRIEPSRETASIFIACCLSLASQKEHCTAPGPSLPGYLTCHHCSLACHDGRRIRATAVRHWRRALHSGKSD